MAKWFTPQTYCTSLVRLSSFFLKYYLEGRTFTVHLNDSTSTPKPTPSSLLQGTTVLMTTSFSLYLSDIAHPLHTHLALYTDNNSRLSWSWHPDTVSDRLNHDVATFHTSLCGNSNLITTCNHSIFQAQLTPSQTLFRSMTPLCPGPQQYDI